MSKFVRAAQTSQSLSLAAMEEASRSGRREADIEHMFLALVINDQVAGQVLRDAGIDLEAARRAVADQHTSQLASLGIDATFPAPGRIVFHETDGYRWSTRAADLVARSSGKGRAGDAAAVLRELVSEPSGLISDVLRRLGSTSDDVLARLDRAEATRPAVAVGRQHEKGCVSGSTQTFVPAPVTDVWELLADPARIPDWEFSVGSIEATAGEAVPGTLWRGCAPQARPDGKPVKVRPQFRRRDIQLVAAEPPRRIVWRFTYPDAHNRPTETELTLAGTTGGTQVTITTSRAPMRGWRRAVGFVVRPLQKLLLWIGLVQTGSAISRVFR